MEYDSIGLLVIHVSTLAVEWIEILRSLTRLPPKTPSPPSRWSGLKYCNAITMPNSDQVSTLAVEWIEMPLNQLFIVSLLSLHPRGGVD